MTYGMEKSGSVILAVRSVSMRTSVPAEVRGAKNRARRGSEKPMDASGTGRGSVPHAADRMP